MALYNRQRARRSILDTVLFRALSQVSSLAGYVIMVRGMSREDFGVLNILYALIPVVSTVASLGIEQVLRRYQPEYLSSGRPEAAHWLVSTAGKMRLGTNLLLLGAIAAGWNLLAPVFQLTEYRMHYWLFCPLIMLHFQARILQLALSSQLMQRHAIGMVVVQSVVKLVAYSTMAALGGLTLVAVIVIDTVAYACLYGGLKISYERGCKPETAVAAFKLEATERKRLMRYAFFNNFNDVGTMVLSTRSDNFFIAAFINPVAVAVYAFYTRLNEMILGALPMRMLANVIQPFFFAVPAGEAARKLPRYFTFLLNINLVVQLPIAAYFLAYHREIVALVAGSKYVDSSWMLPLVFGFSVSYVIAEPTTMIAQHAERAAVILLSKVFAIYNIVAIVVLVPVAGIYGVAIATGSAGFLKNVFIWWHVRDVARWTNLRQVMVAGTLIWGAAVAASLGLKQVLALPDWLHLVLGMVVMSLAGAAYVRSPAVAPSDRELLQSLFHGKEARILRYIGLVKPATGGGG